MSLIDKARLTKLKIKHAFYSKEKVNDMPVDPKTINQLMIRITRLRKEGRVEDLAAVGDDVEQWFLGRRIPKHTLNMLLNSNVRKDLNKLSENKMFSDRMDFIIYDKANKDLKEVLFARRPSMRSLELIPLYSLNKSTGNWELHPAL